MKLLADMAWAIGLFEGEGSIVAGRGNAVSLTVQMIDKDVLSRFFRIVKHGRLRGPYTNRGPDSAKRYQPTYVWTTGKRDDVQALLRLWLPYFGKRRTIRAKIALQRLAQNHGKQLWLACKRGHILTRDNVYIVPTTLVRQCRKCIAIRAQKYLIKRK